MHVGPREEQLLETAPGEDQVQIHRTGLPGERQHVGPGEKALRLGDAHAEASVLQRRPQHPGLGRRTLDSHIDVVGVSGAAVHGEGLRAEHVPPVAALVEHRRQRPEEVSGGRHGA
jgi:hypothetical protein